MLVYDLPQYVSSLFLNLKILAIIINHYHYTEVDFIFMSGAYKMRFKSL